MHERTKDAGDEGSPFGAEVSVTRDGEEIAGKYRIIRLLGEGGMGQVFEAVNKNTERRVAIKTLHPRLAVDGTIVQRFLREARAATRVRHPNVVDVLDFDVDPATRSPYLVQEFLVGDSLFDTLAARPGGRLGVDEALAIMVPVMSALVAAHALGVVHRDLKPDNIFLVRDGRGGVTPKLIDFGIAKVLEGQPEGFRMTQTGAVMGTPSYMSPEQAGGSSSIDGRTDVWSIGVMLYELLVGARPHDAPNYNILVAKILFEEPTPILQVDPTLRPDVAAVVMRALMRDLDARFPSMQAMLDATLACVTDEAIRASAAPSAAPVTAEIARTPAGEPPRAPSVSYGSTAPASTLASWTGQRTPPGRPSSVLLVAATAFVVVALAASAMWITRSTAPPSGAAVLRTPVARPAPPAPPVTPVTPVAVVAPPVVAPPAVAPPVVAAPETVPTSPAAPATTPPPTRTGRGHRARPRRATSHDGQDFDRGYPQ